MAVAPTTIFLSVSVVSSSVVVVVSVVVLDELHPVNTKAASAKTKIDLNNFYIFSSSFVLP